MSGTPNDSLPLSPKQRHAAASIASGQSQRQVAKAFGVSPQTMNSWAHSPAFCGHVESLLVTVERETQQALHGLRLGAVETLSNLLNTGSPAVRLQAAKVVLEATHRPYNMFTGTSPIERQQTEHFQALMLVIEGKTNATPSIDHH
jgi:hypothetical protein